MKSERKKRPLWKRIVWGVGIVLALLVLAFAGLVAYAYWFYEEPMAKSYYLSELPLTKEEFVGDFEEIHQTVAENYSLYRQKGIDMDSLHRVYAGRVAQAETTTDYGKLVTEYIAALQAGHASTPFALYMMPGDVVIIQDSLFVNKPGKYLCQYGFQDKDRIVAVDGVPLLQWAEGQEKYVSASTPSDRHFRAMRNVFRSPVDSLRHYTVLRGGDTLLLAGVENWGKSGRFPKRGNLKKALEPSSLLETRESWRQAEPGPLLVPAPAVSSGWKFFKSRAKTTIQQGRILVYYR